MPVDTIKWLGDINGHADMIDQTLLPVEYKRVQIHDPAAMYDAIKRLVVRGAPAIGIAAAFGVILGLQKVPDDAPAESAIAQVNKTCDYLAQSRPTAVNLFWALDRMKTAASQITAANALQIKQHLLNEAQSIRAEDAAMCRAIGKNGAAFITANSTVLTHCNAGGLATADYGTALAVMFAAQEQGTPFSVYADETRPLLQGSRLTAWELDQANIDVTVICDNMAGHLMSLGKINLVIVGADRITANGDAANKIGTYSLAVLAHAHGIPFYVAAPSSTFDMQLTDGTKIPIEQRAPEEITNAWNHPTAPANVKVYNPAFDVTPARYITAIITERGVIEQPNADKIRDMIARPTS